MNKAEFAKKIAEKNGMTIKQATEVVASVFDTIAEEIKAGEKVQIYGFGTFESKVRAARVYKNPKTGECVDVPETRSMTYKPFKGLKKL